MPQPHHVTIEWPQPITASPSTGNRSKSAWSRDTNCPMRCMGKSPGALLGSTFLLNERKERLPVIWGCNSPVADPLRMDHMGEHKTLETLWSWWAKVEKPGLRISSWREDKSLPVVQTTSLLGVLLLGRESLGMHWGSQKGRPWGFLNLPTARILPPGKDFTEGQWEYFIYLNKSCLNPEGIFFFFFRNLTEQSQNSSRNINRRDNTNKKNYEEKSIDMSSPKHTKTYKAIIGNRLHLRASVYEG